MVVCDVVVVGVVVTVVVVVVVVFGDVVVVTVVAVVGGVVVVVVVVVVVDVVVVGWLNHALTVTCTFVSLISVRLSVMLKSEDVCMRTSFTVHKNDIMFAWAM